MDRDFTLEKHLLTRSYSSQAEIHQIIDARYKNHEAADPYLVLLPTSKVEGIKPTLGPRTHLGKNIEILPGLARKLNTRKDMKVYIKQTLAAQKKAVARFQQAQRQNHTFDVERYITKHNIPKFEQYLQLHGLWQQYINELLFGEQKNPNVNMVLPKLLTADFNGCWLRVIEAKDRNLVGMHGIVLYDSQHAFMVVVPPVTKSDHVISPAQRVGGLRVLLKRGTMFAFDVKTSATDSVAFTILGSRFELRAVDRAGKKFKSHGVEDIY